MVKPYVDAVNLELGYKAEFLLTQDRGPGHDDGSASLLIFDYFLLISVQGCAPIRARGGRVPGAHSF